MPPLVVAGSHRSGTSATTRALNLCGLDLVPAEDLMAPNEGNPDGYWESSTLTELDDRLLQLQGCSWSAPPPNPGTELDDRLDWYLSLGRQLIDRLLPGDRWIWKDPRACLLLPFWRQVVPEAAFLVVHRNPLGAADSLARRDDFSLAYGLALWERYVGSYVAGLAGAPAVVVSWEQMTADPEQSLRSLVSDLAKLGIELEVTEEAVQSIRPSAGRERGQKEVPSEARAMHETLLELGGAHESFPALDPPPESEWVEPLLAAHRRAQILRVVPA